MLLEQLLEAEGSVTSPQEDVSSTDQSECDEGEFKHVFLLLIDPGGLGTSGTLPILLINTWYQTTMYLFLLR